MPGQGIRQGGKRRIMMPGPGIRPCDDGAATREGNSMMSGSRGKTMPGKKGGRGQVSSSAKAILGMHGSGGRSIAAFMKQALSDRAKESKARARVAAVNSKGYHMRHLPNVSDDGDGVTLASSSSMIGVFEIAYDKGIEGRGQFTEKVLIFDQTEATNVVESLSQTFLQSMGKKGVLPHDIAAVPRLFWSIVYNQQDHTYDRSQGMRMDLMLKRIAPKVNWSHLDHRGGGRSRALSSKALANEIQKGNMCILDDQNMKRKLEALHGVLIYCDGLALLEGAVTKAEELVKQIEKFDSRGTSFGLNFGLVLGIYGSLLTKVALLEALPPILDVDSNESGDQTDNASGDDPHGAEAAANLIDADNESGEGPDNESGDDPHGAEAAANLNLIEDEDPDNESGDDPHGAEAASNLIEDEDADNESGEGPGNESGDDPEAAANLIDEADNIDVGCNNDLDLADEIMTSSIAKLRNDTEVFGAHLIADLNYYTGLVCFFHAQLQLHRKLYGMAHESCVVSFFMLHQYYLSLKLGKIGEDPMKAVKFVDVNQTMEQILNLWKEVLTRNGKKDMVVCDQCRGIWKKGKKEFCNSGHGYGDEKKCGKCQLIESGELLQKVSCIVQTWSEEMPPDAAIKIMNAVRGIAHSSH
jgi:hypothetical protein